MSRIERDGVRPHSKGLVTTFLRVGELIRTYGTPGKLYGRVNLYLINPEGTQRIWRMREDEPSLPT